MTPNLLLRAYANGYFPMPDPDTGEPLWYKPDPRAIIPITPENGFHCSRSLAKKLKRNYFDFTIDTNFSAVIRGCAARPETWINQEFIDAYTEMHSLGWAHSVEVWSKAPDGAKVLAGGIYGLAINGAFFAESMFHLVTDGSKAALWYLTEHMRKQEMTLLEVQFLTPHLASLGAIQVPAKDYERFLVEALAIKTQFITD